MSKIGWTGITWNPVTGCNKISPACDNCYAEPMANRMKNNPKMRGKYQNGFKVTYHLNELNRDFGAKPKKIFLCSMGDLFHKDVPFVFIWDVFRHIRRNPQHIFQVLTKRPERMHQFLEKLQDDFVPDNAWIGITAENFEIFAKRSWYLDGINAKVKFISMEPLLEDIAKINLEEFQYYLQWFDWVIVGGETGPKARDMNPEWARNVRDECKLLEIPFFFKQMSYKSEIPADLMIKEFPKRGPT